MAELLQQEERPTTANFSDDSSITSESIPMPERPKTPKKKYDNVPETMDAKYLVSRMGSTLTTALHEISEKRPCDPIEYLAHWLYNYAQERDRKRADRDAEYMIEVEKAEELKENIRRRRRIKEETFLKAEEAEKQRKEREEEEKAAKAKEEEIKRLKELEELKKRQREEADPYAQPPDLATVSEEHEAADSDKNKGPGNSNDEQDTGRESDEKEG